MDIEAGLLGWGHRISILSQYFNVEIAVVDTQSCRIDRFGEDKFYKERIFVIYDGIHYDPLIMEPLEPSQLIQTVFPTSDAAVLGQAMEIASEAKALRHNTDVANFCIRCLVCQKLLSGQTEACLGYRPYQLWGGVKSQLLMKICCHDINGFSRIYKTS